MSFRVIYNNLWRNGTAGTPSTASPQFPIYDTQLDTLFMRFRTTGVSDENTGYVDLGAEYEYDFISILGHNFTSGATIEVIGADDTSGTNAVTESVTWATGNIHHVFATAQTKRYVKIRVQDPGNSAGYLEIKTVVLGKALTLGRGLAGSRAQGPVDNSIGQQSDALVTFSMSRARLGVWDIAFEGLSDSDAEQVQNWIEEAGTEFGFIVCFDTVTPAGNTFFVKFQGDPGRPVKAHTNNWSWSATVIEVV